MLERCRSKCRVENRSDDPGVYGVVVTCADSGGYIVPTPEWIDVYADLSREKKQAMVTQFELPLELVAEPSKK